MSRGTVTLVTLFVLATVSMSNVPSFGSELNTEDSPRWWTLTDEISPAELRAIHEDIELHKERYREAVKAGRKPLLPKQQMELLNFFIDGSTHPELFPMWLAFDSFAAGFAFEWDDPRASLAEFGFEGDVLKTIAHISVEYRREVEILQKEIHEDFKAVGELVRLGKKNLGEKNFNNARKARDATMLANATGYSVEEVERILEIWEGTRADDFAAQALPLLKEALEPTDWDRFRLYLLEVQAPMMFGQSYAELEEN